MILLDLRASFLLVFLFSLFCFYIAESIKPFYLQIFNRENDGQVQSSSVPVFQSHPASPGHGFQVPQLDSVSPYVTDQFGNMRPLWYNPHSDR